MGNTQGEGFMRHAFLYLKSAGAHMREGLRAWRTTFSACVLKMLRVMLMITMGVSQALTTSDWAVFCPYGDMFCSYTEIYLHE